MGLPKDRGTMYVVQAWQRAGIFGPTLLIFDACPPKQFELRWPRITKIYDQSERDWNSAIDLMTHDQMARRAIDPDLLKIADDISGGPEQRADQGYKAEVNFWMTKLERDDIEWAKKVPSAQTRAKSKAAQSTDTLQTTMLRPASKTQHTIEASELRSSRISPAIPVQNTGTTNSTSCMPNSIGKAYKKPQASALMHTSSVTSDPFPTLDTVVEARAAENKNLQGHLIHKSCLSNRSIALSPKPSTSVSDPTAAQVSPVKQTSQGADVSMADKIIGPSTRTRTQTGNSLYAFRRAPVSVDRKSLVVSVRAEEPGEVQKTYAMTTPQPVNLKRPLPDDAEEADLLTRKSSRLDHNTWHNTGVSAKNPTSGQRHTLPTVGSPSIETAPIENRARSANARTKRGSKNVERPPPVPFLHLAKKRFKPTSHQPAHSNSGSPSSSNVNDFAPATPSQTDIRDLSSCSSPKHVITVLPIGTHDPARTAPTAPGSPIVRPTLAPVRSGPLARNSASRPRHRFQDSETSVQLPNSLGTDVSHRSMGTRTTQSTTSYLHLHLPDHADVPSDLRGGFQTQVQVNPNKQPDSEGAERGPGLITNVVPHIVPSSVAKHSPNLTKPFIAHSASEKPPWLQASNVHWCLVGDNEDYGISGTRHRTVTDLLKFFEVPYQRYHSELQPSTVSYIFVKQPRESTLKRIRKQIIIRALSDPHVAYVGYDAKVLNIREGNREIWKGYGLFRFNSFEETYAAQQAQGRSGN